MKISIREIKACHYNLGQVVIIVVVAGPPVPEK